MGGRVAMYCRSDAVVLVATSTKSDRWTRILIIDRRLHRLGRPEMAPLVSVKPFRVLDNNQIRGRAEGLLGRNLIARPVMIGQEKGFVSGTGVDTVQ